MVESQSETVWRQADRYHIPRIAFVNKLDRVESSYVETLDMIEERLGVVVVPLQLPYRDDDRRLQGMVDLLSRKMVVWNEESKGERYEFHPVPEAMEASVEHYRERMIDRVAETDDKVMEEYLASGDVTPELFHAALRHACIDRGYLPVLGGSAFHNQGVQPLLDAVVRYLPSPLDVPAVCDVESGETRAASPDEPFSALAFKVVSDQYLHPRLLRASEGRWARIQSFHG